MSDVLSVRAMLQWLVATDRHAGAVPVHALQVTSGLLLQTDMPVLYLFMHCRSRVLLQLEIARVQLV